MDVKLCRICGKLDENYVHIFKVEGLKNKIETCLPIVINQYSLLPDTICNGCRDSVDNFYSFIKNCLQNIIVLEAQYEIIDSCLKTKRKKDKSCCVSESDFETITKNETKKTVPEENFVNLLKNSSLNLKSSDNFVLNPLKNDNPIPNFQCSLVDYEFSDSNSGFDEFKNKVSDIKTETNKSEPPSVDNSQKLCSSDIISEIKQRKYLKRKIDEVLPNLTKNLRNETETSNRRKNKQPKKVEYYLKPKIEPIASPFEENFIKKSLPEENTKILSSTNESSKKFLTESTQNLSDNFLPEKILTETTSSLVPETFQSCLLCEQQFYGPVLLTAHMYETHGIDLTQVFTQNQNQPITNGSSKKKLPELVKIGDVLPKKQVTQENFDDPPILEPQIPPPTCQSISNIPSFKNLTCNECSNGIIYPTFKEFSNHRRSQHQIFHCDLCLKYYGRNSHLWKHVNRVHKGHPSITCKLCSKTSASKYHLSQHIAKMHSTKKTIVTDPDPPILTPEDDLLSKKFDGFDFQSVRQSFLIQDMLEKSSKKKEIRKDNSRSEKSQMKESKIEKTQRIKVPVENPPKEIDSTSELYTNIITNYTPPPNEGTYKCPKCFKSFYKKNLLKKHKKNCRPRLQKDLLTRCKTCSRIFKDRQSLTKHLINYHSEYTCEICSQAFQSKCEIVSHIRFLHPNSPELVCHCGQILRSKVDLVKHKMDHKDTHVCQFCGDLLPTKIKLKMHILSLHRKILSLSCGICLKLFETQQILRDHVNLVHFDQLSPLTSCTVCGKNYGSKWKTYDHLNKSHGRIFKACKNCLGVFESEEDLQKHFETEHNKKNVNNLEKKISFEKKNFDTKNENDGNGDLMKIQDENSSHSENSLVQENLNKKKIIQENLDYSNYVNQNYSSLNPKKIGENIKKSKISLLEKRLLGKKISNEKIYKKNKKLKIQNAKAKLNFEKFDEDLIQNSSKRTVYVNSNDPSLCEICLKTWPAKKHLWQHYIRCHKQVAATVCGICLKTNPSYSSLQVHLRENHPNLLHGCGFGSNFICKICGRYHNASSKLKLHMAIHVGFNENILYEKNFDKNHFEPDENHENSSENFKNKSKEENLPEINYEHMIEEIEYSNSGSEKFISNGSPQNEEISDNENVNDQKSYESNFSDQKTSKNEYLNRKGSKNEFLDQKQFQNKLPNDKKEFLDQNSSKNELLDLRKSKSEVFNLNSSKKVFLDQGSSKNDFLDQQKSKKDLNLKKAQKISESLSLGSDVSKNNSKNYFHKNDILDPKIGFFNKKNVISSKISDNGGQKINFSDPKSNHSPIASNSEDEIDCSESKTDFSVLTEKFDVEKNEEDDEICSDSEPESENFDEKVKFLKSENFDTISEASQNFSSLKSVENNEIGDQKLEIFLESDSDLEKNEVDSEDLQNFNQNPKNFDQNSNSSDENSDFSYQNPDVFKNSDYNSKNFDRNYKNIAHNSKNFDSSFKNSVGSKYSDRDSKNSDHNYKNFYSNSKNDQSVNDKHNLKNVEYNSENLDHNSKNSDQNSENFDYNSEYEENGVNLRNYDYKDQNSELLGHTSKNSHYNSKNLVQSSELLDHNSKNFDYTSENFDYNSDNEENVVTLENLDFDQNHENFETEIDQEFTEIEYDHEIIYEDNILTLNSKENSIISEESNHNYSDSETEQEKNLEQEMLKNMLGENVIVTKQDLILNDNSNGDDQNEIFWSNSPEGNNKELDSAIKSISYNEIDVLTETELETAVDSIL